MELQLSNFKHSLEIQIRFNDIDSFNHVNNAITHEYFDLGRMSYLSDILNFEYIKLDDKNLVIVSTKTDFIQPVHLEDKLTVYTKVFYIGDKSLKMMQWLVKDGKTTPAVTCASVMAGFIPSKEISMEIPDKWRIALNQYESGDC